MTGREPEVGPAETSSRAAVAVMRAITDSTGCDPLMLHLGSIAEASRMPLSAYAAGKVAARQEAAADARIATLTVPIVPRDRGARQDRPIRVLCRVSPRVARLPIPVADHQALARAIAMVLGYGPAAVGKQIVLAARLQQLGTVLGTGAVGGALGNIAARFLATAPTGWVLELRTRSLVRAALGKEVREHYAAATTPSTEQVGRGRSELLPRRNQDGLGNYWLTLADIEERKPGHV
ncbi:MAG: hypothetical protein ACRCYU_02840 [Nocardioides sp.]